jgi:tetratricopeptide (TPR) repeat protein
LLKVLDNDPGHEEARLLLGIVYARTQEHGKAAEALERYSRLHPESVVCLNWLSIAYRRQGLLDKAVVAAQKVLKLTPDDPEALNNLGLAFFSRSNFAQALEPFLRAAEHQPNNPQIRHNLGLVYQSLGRDVEAAESYRQAIRLSKNAIPSYIGLGNLMLLHGNSEGALQSARTILQQDPNLVQAHFLAAQALTNLSEPAAAETHLRHVLGIDPNNATALGMLGFKLQSRGNFVKAEEAFRKSLANDPLQGISYWGLRQGKKAKPEDLDKVKEMLEKLEDPRFREADRFFLLFAVAKTYADLGQFKEAMQYYDLANKAARQNRPHTHGFDKELFQAFMARTRELLSEEFLARHSHLGSESDKPIFVVGMMRSGTTLMEQILSSHPMVAAGGELRFWLERGPKVVDLATRTIDEGRAKELISDYLAILNRIDPEARVTDKMPQNLQVLGLIHVLFPRAKVINMNRNPVENCFSIYITPYEMPPEFAHDQENIVCAYRQNEEMANHWRRVLPAGSFLDVRYEELVENSEAVIRKVLEYCELEWDERCLRHTENRRIVSTPSVWQVRQPIYQSSLERWRDYEPYLGALRELIPKSVKEGSGLE